MYFSVFSVSKFCDDSTAHVNTALAVANPGMYTMSRLTNQEISKFSTRERSVSALCYRDFATG
jgi:hypothetical protein